MIARFLPRSLAALTLAVLSGCASSPPPPSTEPAPEVTVPAPAVAPSASAESKAEPPSAPTSEPTAAKEAPPPVPSSKAAPAKAPPEITGTLVSRQGTDVTVDIGSGSPPAVGDKGVLSRHFEQQLGPLSTSGWLVIADIVVKKVSGGKLVLTIAEEKSTILMNGKKVDHFKAGTPIKLEMGKSP